MKKPKEIALSLAAAKRLLVMVNMGKVRIVKEQTPDGPAYWAESASGTPIGIIGPKYKYLFEKAILENGAADGLFHGFSQTTRLAK